MFQDFLYKHPVGASALRTGRMRTFCPLLEPQLHLPCSPSAALVLNPLAEEANHQNHQMATTVGHRGATGTDRETFGFGRVSMVDLERALWLVLRVKWLRYNSTGRGSSGDLFGVSVVVSQG